MSKFTKGPWYTVQAGATTMIYGPEGERVCKIFDNKKDAALIEMAPDLLYMVKQIYHALPTTYELEDDEPFEDILKRFRQFEDNQTSLLCLTQDGDSNSYNREAME